MKQIVFLGNSPIVPRVIELIRLEDQDSEITVFTLDGLYPYWRNQLPGLLSREIKEDKIYSKATDFYRKNRVNVLLDRQITRINAKKKRLVTQEKDQVEFDSLIVAQPSSWRSPHIKGHQRQGVFQVNQLNQIKKISQLLPLTETVIIEGNCPEALMFATSLMKRGKEVLWIAADQYLLAHLLDEQMGRLLTSLLKDKSIRIILENNILEILGDNDMKAVRLTNKKVLSAQMLILSTLEAELKFVAESDFKLEQGRFVVNENFETNVPQIYAADAVAINAGGWSLEQQAQAIAAGIFAREQRQDLTPQHVELSLDDATVDILGKTNFQNLDQTIFNRNPHTKVYKKIFLHNEQIEGCILINASEQVSQWSQWIKDHKSIGEIPADFLQEPTMASSSI